jgi:hypothetical protein
MPNQDVEIHLTGSVVRLTTDVDVALKLCEAFQNRARGNVPPWISLPGGQGYVLTSAITAITVRDAKVSVPEDILLMLVPVIHEFRDWLEFQNKPEHDRRRVEFGLWQQEQRLKAAKEACCAGD